MRTKLGSSSSSSDCLFCKIVSGAIPASRVYEDECCIGFPDINPQAPTHLLIIPKQHIGSTAKALAEDTALMGHLMAAAAEIAPTHRTLGDVDSHESLAEYQAKKRAHKAALRAAKAT